MLATRDTQAHFQVPDPVALLTNIMYSYNTIFETLHAQEAHRKDRKLSTTCLYFQLGLDSKLSGRIYRLQYVLSFQSGPNFMHEQ